MEENVLRKVLGLGAFELQPPHKYSHTLSTSHPLRVLISALVVPDWAGTAEWGGLEHRIQLPNHRSKRAE